MKIELPDVHPHEAVRLAQNVVDEISLGEIQIGQLCAVFQDMGLKVDYYMNGPEAVIFQQYVSYKELD
jgi:hypothetical protein